MCITNTVQLNHIEVSRNDLAEAYTQYINCLQSSVTHGTVTVADGVGGINVYNDTDFVSTTRTEIEDVIEDNGDVVMFQSVDGNYSVTLKADAEYRLVKDEQLDGNGYVVFFDTDMIVEKDGSTNSFATMSSYDMGEYENCLYVDTLA